MHFAAKAFTLIIQFSVFVITEMKIVICEALYQLAWTCVAVSNKVTEIICSPDKGSDR